MATPAENIDTKTAKNGKNGKSVVAEKAKTTEADGYSPPKDSQGRDSRRQNREP